jgi:acyl-CoA thioesterase YciA
MNNINKEYELCFRSIVKYPDCNATENLFGGKLLLWLDESVAIAASRHMKYSRIVTKKINEMTFETPTELRKIVSIYSKVLQEGKTSITMHAVATKADGDGCNEIVIAKATIVYVAIDEFGIPFVWNT